MRYLNSYSLIKESVVEAKSAWSKAFPDKPNVYLEPLKEIFKKNPGYIGKFTKLLITDLNNNPQWFDKPESVKTLTDDIKAIYDIIIKHKQLFSNLDIENFNDLEHLYDYITGTLDDNDLTVFIKSFISNKYSHLIDNKTRELFKTILFDMKIDKEILKQFIFKKIAKYKNSNEFNISVESFINNGDYWNKTNIIENISKTTSKIVFENETSLVVRVYDYPSMQSLGSKSWCIVTSESLFNHYVTNNCQYIIYDFSKEPFDNSSIIGVTIYGMSGIIRTAHLKDDKKAVEEDYIEWKEYLLGYSIEDLLGMVENDTRNTSLLVKYATYNLFDYAKREIDNIKNKKEAYSILNDLANSRHADFRVFGKIFNLYDFTEQETIDIMLQAYIKYKPFFVTEIFESDKVKNKFHLYSTYIMNNYTSATNALNLTILTYLINNFDKNEVIDDMDIRQLGFHYRKNTASDLMNKFCKSSIIQKHTNHTEQELFDLMK